MEVWHSAVRFFFWWRCCLLNKILLMLIYIFWCCYTSREGTALCLIGFFLCHFNYPPFLQKFVVSQKSLLVSPLTKKGGITKWHEQLHLFVFVCLFMKGQRKAWLGKGESLKGSPAMVQQTESKRRLFLAYVTSCVSSTRRYWYATHTVISQY